MPSSARYDRFGWDYERFNPLEKRALAWYRWHALRTGGPVLELACGTGRLLAALAADGHEVVGLDGSDAMLQHARRRLGEAATLVRGDMRAFEVDRSFALVIVADNALREIETEEGILACLRCVRRHLRPDGRLLVTERRFVPDRYPDRELEHPWAAAGRDPATGKAWERRVRVRLAPDGRRLLGVMTYRLVGSSREVDLPFESLVLHPEDYRRLFAAGGFDCEPFVGYEARADDGVDPILCFVCTSRA